MKLTRLSLVLSVAFLTATSFAQNTAPKQVIVNEGNPVIRLQITTTFHKKHHVLSILSLCHKLAL